MSTNTTIPQMIQGARLMGITLQTGDDDQLTYDARYEPSPGTLERISERKDAIIALLASRRASSRIAWDKIQDITVEEYAALVESVKEDLAALQSSLDRLEHVGVAITPTMEEHRCSWGEAVKRLLAKPGNATRRRPKHVSDEEWIAAVYQAHVLGLRGPASPRGVIR
jgi:hypothetical protein